ncbi:MAG: glycine-rich protein [Caldilineaceae bacterium]
MTNQRQFFQRPRLWGLLCGLTLTVAQFFSPASVGIAQAATTTCTPNGALQDCTVTFSASGAHESWTVPAGVTSATFDLYGAAGGGGPASSGLGGRVTATLAVTPGASYQVRVGIWGYATGIPAGYNGGGDGYADGGGASDVRGGAFGLADRLLVAGGGGGTGGGLDVSASGGGAGGYPSGGAGGAGGGGGGTQTAGGAGGVSTVNGSAGTLGQGGAGGIWDGPGSTGGRGGGGGGGYYGGGGGGGGGVTGGGGGGSSYATPAATNVSFQSGVRSENGQVIISYTQKDTTAPVANPTQSPAAAPSGWNNTSVTVSWNWSDPATSSGPVSGIDPANCTTSSVASGSATVTVTATCKDLAGNTGTASYSVRIDPTAPTANPSQSPAANGAGWNNTDVTVDWNWTFTGAEIDTANCTTSSTSSGEGTLTLSATCKDVALNQRTATYVVKVDKTAPVITGSRTPPANSEGWNNSAVTVDFTCQEQGTGSGLATNTVGGVTVSTQGANQTATNSGACVDVAGNEAAAATVGAINIDLTKPTITADVSAFPNANGWFKTNVPISFLCDDALSGIATCSPDEILSSEGAAVSSTPHTSSDKAGNVSDPSNIVTVKIDKTAPVVTVTGVSNGASYNLGSVPTAACSSSDALSGVATQATMSVTGGNPDGAGSFTATCSGATDLAGNSAAAVSVSYSVNPPADTTAPDITPNVVGTLGNNGWYVSDVTVGWTVMDNESTISSQSGCETQNITGDSAGVTFTCSATSDGGSSSESVTIKRDVTMPVVTVTGVSDGAGYTVGSVPTAACDTSDATSGVATQATVTVTGGNPDGTGNFTATCSGAADNAGNSADAVSVSYTVTAPVDVCTTTALRDDFNRANGGLGSNWAGLTGQSFYKIAGNGVDVQLGGPVVWKPTTFGVNQAAFVTLNTLDANSPSQGVLLKVQSGSIPNAGAIAVVYDSVAKAVRVSTLRLNTPTWTTYGNTAATVANGDTLLGCVQADGTVRVYQNNSLLTTVTLNSADQSFFNAKGGKIGLWTVAALNATFDDFGGGALTSVSSAAVDVTVPAEVADDGAEITVAENFPTDDTDAPEAGNLVNRLFLPLVNR